MGVFKSTKKMSRRTRKAVRRALSGVCMASALIVALVPARITTAYVAPTINNTYSYGVEASDFTNLSDFDADLKSVDLSKYGTTGYTDSDSTIHKTMTVKQLSSGAYEIGWQFKLYTLASSGKGVICEYNSMYATGTLEIASLLPLSYLVVEEDFFNNFFDAHSAAKTSNTEYATIKSSPQNYTTTSIKSKYYITSVSNTIDNSLDQYWIEKYFPEQFNTYKTSYNTWVIDKAKYDKYLVDLDAYNTDPSSGTAPAVVENPGECPSCTCWIADMDITNKYKYFCAAQPYYRDKLNGIATAETYTLEKVVDSRNGSTTPVTYCYMPKGTPNQQLNSIDVNDEYGFLGSNWTTVLGIGDNAFKDTANVTSLKLADEIKYIGDYAFYNSFVESISFDNVMDIGNRAFKNCTRLKTINLSNTTKNIGTEAFYGCNSLRSLSLPESIDYIGPGAFATCTALVTLDLSAINQNSCNIDNFAFYDDIALTSISFSDSIARIGEGAFACGMGVTGNLTRFNFPDHISNANGIGNFVLAGRTNIKEVTMPSDYGRSTAVELPYGVFYNCINLEKLTFPADGGGSCGYVSYGSYGSGDDKRTIFDTIQTASFCVYGPETNAAGKVASPRLSTWGLKTGLDNDVPYIYTNSSGEHVEISNGQYILIIDDEGVLQSCSFANSDMKTEALANGLDLEIPEYVGDTKVTGIATDCFLDPDVHDNIKTITIADNTISEIAAEAFKGCTRLTEVHIGNSVTKIGASAFEGCKNLTYVEFDTPVNGYSSFPVENIGEKAFATGSDSLIFEGDIDTSYGPFVWAMGLDNYVDSDLGTRVCYKTGYPTYLTVIVDNRNGLPTLVDHPHYELINKYSQTEGNAVNYIDAEGNAQTASWQLTDRYENLGNEFYDYTDASNPILYTYSISLQEEKMIKAALNLDVPAGIKSIDTYGFINNTSKQNEALSGPTSNTVNVSKYLSPLIKNYAVDGETIITADTIDTYKKYGLFKGYYGDYTVTEDGSSVKADYNGDSKDAALYELEAIGNDRIESITLHTVEYLPDYAFYSCEKLSSITLGDSMQDLGTAPFTGCTSLTGIGSTTDGVICYNGIVYSENDDSTYNIVEVLSARGKSVGSKKIKVSDEDPYLANVSTISDGAFENCDYISGVDFRGVDLLTEIPDNCFKDCDTLNQVILPDNITSIGHNAFAGAMEGIELVCYGTEVYLPSDAFGTKTIADDNEYVEAKRVISYKDSAVRKAARDLSADVSETLDDTVKVQFFDYDGTELSDLIYVDVGSSVSLEDIPKDPLRTGYSFSGWNKALTNITTDSVIVATYTQNASDSSSTVSDNNTTSDSNTNTSTSGGTTSTSTAASNTTLYTLTVTNGNGSGSYAEGATVIITCTNPPSGYVFDKWVTNNSDLGIASVNVAATTLKMPAHEASVEATFKAAPSNTSGSGSGSESSGSQTSTKTDTNTGNTIVISKSGISNTSLASASVTGSSDNYVIRITETAAATAAVEKALTNEYGSLDAIRYTAMDITLYDATGTNKITDYSGLSITITLPLPDVLASYAGNNKVAGVVNEKLDKLNPKFTSIDGVPCITFTATHFSPYTIYVNTANASATAGTTIDASPKTGDGIQPKWFLVAGLAALSIALFFMKDKKTVSDKAFAQEFKCLRKLLEE